MAVDVAVTPTGDPETLTVNGLLPLVGTWTKLTVSPPVDPVSPNVSDPDPAIKSLAPAMDPNTVLIPLMASGAPPRYPTPYPRKDPR